MRSYLLALIAAPIACTLAGCATEGELVDANVVQSQSANSGGWAGGGGNWGGGGGNWGGGGGLWGGGGGNWGGGGGFWGGGGSNWGGGGGNWGGGGGQWGGGGGYWGGGGGWWGGGGNWGGGGGLWGGGFANTFPFFGWSFSRHWQFRGVPKAGYTFDPANPTRISGTKDTASCASGQVRLGGFAYAIDVEGSPAFVALGYHKGLCIPTPGNGGLSVNPTSGDPSLLTAGGYDLTATGTADKDVVAMKTMVGWGSANVATQFGGALCASIGSLAAAKRSCGVGIAYTDVNRNKDGSLSQRGVSVSSAQNNVFSHNTPFGRQEGHGLYGEAPNDMESYANQVLHRHKTVTVPKTPADIDAWNSANAAGFAYNGSSFTVATDPGAPVMAPTSDPAKLFADANRSVDATRRLNMIPVDANTNNAATGSVVLMSDMQQSLSARVGDLYSLSLHSLAFNQSPLYGSGGGRWFFRANDDGTKSLMELSSIFQGSTYVLTGQLNGSPSTAQLSKAHISQLSIRYADWRPDSGNTGTPWIDNAQQLPWVPYNDFDGDIRLANAFHLEQPKATIASGAAQTCAISSAGGELRCWGKGSDGRLGNGNSGNANYPAPQAILSSGVTAVTTGDRHTCALMATGTVKCWGYNANGQLGNGTTKSSSTPVDVPNLANITSIKAGKNHVCAVRQDRKVLCWGANANGQVGDGTTVDKLSPIVVSPLYEVGSVAVGDTHSCAISGAGANVYAATVYCWGNNADGQLGVTLSSATYSNKPVQVATSGVLPATSIDAGAAHTCVATLGGDIRCFGRNDKGQLGTNNLTSSSTPATVYGTTGSGAIKVATGADFTCALFKGGAMKCWGSNALGQLGLGASVNKQLTPATVNVGASVTGLTAGTAHTCVRSNTGDAFCWGDNSTGQLGTGSTGGTVAVRTNSVANVKNGGLITSQASVLISKFTGSTGVVAGHITPIPWSFRKTSKQRQALMVTYDPLAVAAASFIDQFDAHIAACNATTGEDITEADQAAGRKLWACSKPDTKQQYLDGMHTFLNGARQYLFGRVDGCIQSTETVDGAACPTTLIDIANAHLPYTFVVPRRLGTEPSTFNDEYYATQLVPALDSYRAGIIASNGTRLERTLQLAGQAEFTKDNAIVTSSVMRSGDYGTDCVVNDGFTYQ